MPELLFFKQIAFQSLVLEHNLSRYENQTINIPYQGHSTKPKLHKEALEEIRFTQTQRQKMPFQSNPHYLPKSGSPEIAHSNYSKKGAA